MKRRLFKPKTPILAASLSMLILLSGCQIGSQSVETSETTTSIPVETVTETESESESDTTEETSTTQATHYDPTTIAFVGDIMLFTTTQQHYDSSGILGVVDEAMLEVTAGSDILMVNNEFPFSSGGTPDPEKDITFRVDPKYISIIKDLGTDVATLANNHALDYGTDALMDTFTTFENAGIEFSGAGRDYEEASKLVTFEKNGKTFGFLSASRYIWKVEWNINIAAPGIFCTYDPTQLLAEIKEAKQQCDYVYVMVHWGTEHSDVLESYQTELAHAYIEAGADGVFGSHTHCLQAVEIYDGKPIFYSLGNFIFEPSCDRTAAVQLTVTEDNNVSIRIVAAYAADYQTCVMDSAQAQSVYDYLESLSPTVSIDENGYVTARQ